jgi:serine/threonine-protein kinase ULK4
MNATTWCGAGIINALTEGLSDSSERVRRRMMACLGELLFYIAIQGVHGDGQQSVWAVPDSTIQAVAALLAAGEDPVTQVGLLPIDGPYVTVKRQKSIG